MSKSHNIPRPLPQCPQHKIRKLILPFSQGCFENEWEGKKASETLSGDKKNPVKPRQ